MPHFNPGDVVPFKDAENTTLTIVKLIGSGHQADVYAALDIQDGRPVAVKHCYGTFATDKAMFRKKVQLLAASPSPHPDLCWPMKVSALTKNGSFLFAMPLLEGFKPLTGVITGKDPLTDNQKALLLYKIAKIFRVLHTKEKEFVFGDISDRNIMYRLDASGDIQVKVIDCDNVTVPGLSLGLNGTGKYRAPELLLPDPTRKDGRPECPSIQSDVYALQVLAFRVLLRRHPLDGELARTRRSDDPDGFLEFYARRPRFIFDGNTNSPGPRITAKWNSLPEPMKIYFRVAFSQECLKDKTKRVSMPVLMKCLSLSYHV